MASGCMYPLNAVLSKGHKNAKEKYMRVRTDKMVGLTVLQALSDKAYVNKKNKTLKYKKRDLQYDI